MRILVADDHALLREGLIGVLGSAHPTWEFDQAASLDGIMANLALEPTHLLVIDLRMPGMDGGHSLRALREAYPDMKVVVLTGVDDRATILECLSAGVHGYILKLDATEQLLGAVATVLAGGVYVPAALTHVMDKLDSGSSLPLRRPDVAVPVLTPRQNDVMTLLAEGRSTKSIARTLSLGVGTVKVHLAAIYRALGVQTRMEAVVKAGALMNSDQFMSHK